MIGAAPAVIGRAEELDAVRAVADAALRGTASALLISGEAGIGKTTLVRQACSGAQGRLGVLWASCLPLTSLAAPLLPLRTALRHACDADGPLSTPPALATVDAALELDSWLDDVAVHRPVLLVVDDVQWADQSSLDALMYVLAGQANRRVGVLVTLRAGERPVEHGLRRWLADVRRLPRVRELVLGRLDRVGTRDQLTALLGRTPHESLVDDVYGRTCGNPYLTSLLVRGLSPDATTLPAHLPSELRDALARAWHLLSPAAQRLTAVVAVAGRPERTARLAHVAPAVGLTDPVVPLLREAIDAGVLRSDEAGRYWFTHPLLAEVLIELLLPDERRTLHAAFTAMAPALQEADVDEAVALADHYQQAGEPDAAYRWALRGTALAEANGGLAEAARLLRRALDLWAQVADPGETRVSLLQRLRDCTKRAGREAEELSAVEELLALIDHEREPLLAAPLLGRRMLLRFATGREFAGVAGVREAERLSARYPDSPEHAQATARLAYALLWHGDVAGIEVARTGLQLAEACGSDEALVIALVAHAMACRQSGDPRSAAYAARASDIAVRMGDPELVAEAAYMVVNTLDATRSHEYAGVYHRAHKQLEAMGAPHVYIAEMCAWEAHALLVAGDWRGCLAKLRVALGGRPGALGDTVARLTAAVLAARQGRETEAAAHLARAEELFHEHSSFLALNFDAVRVELAAAGGDTERAVALAVAGLHRDVPPLDVERLLPLAARALADRAVADRDHGVDPAAAVARLDALRRDHPDVVSEPGATSRWDRAYKNAMRELADAETARGRAAGDQAARWHRAAELCHDAGLAWDELYSRARAAEAALGDRSTRDSGVAALRLAHHIAADLQATPLLADLETLARAARVPLAEPAARGSEAPPPVRGLTAREREILGHLVAGRTYREIAEALVLSEKTVSVHVSNLLRKTGTGNRTELAQLANRLQAPT